MKSENKSLNLKIKSLQIKIESLEELNDKLYDKITSLKEEKDSNRNKGKELNKISP